MTVLSYQTSTLFCVVTIFTMKASLATFRLRPDARAISKDDGSIYERLVELVSLLLVPRQADNLNDIHQGLAPFEGLSGLVKQSSPRMEVFTQSRRYASTHRSLLWHTVSGDAIAETRLIDGAFISEYDLQRRIHSIRGTELTLLAKIGAFNWTGEKHHRRTAIWRAERAGQNVGPLFSPVVDEHEADVSSPLQPMTVDERLVSDFGGSGLTLGPHPMAYHRKRMNQAGIIPATDLKREKDGTYARIAGAVIARQRPGTAQGFIFLSLEDETGISNAIINPPLYERNRVAVTRRKFLTIEGVLQNQDGVVNVRASAVHILHLNNIDLRSHDFR